MSKRHTRLRSECGRYIAERTRDEERDSLLNWRLIAATTGAVVVERVGFWSDRGTITRIGFEIGLDSISATFSYPRYPAWFRRRWVSCFDAWIEDVCGLVHEHGGRVLTCWKPDINCWTHVGFKANVETTRAIDAAMTAKGWDWVGPRRKTPGMWDINCPSDPDKAHAKLMDALAKRATAATKEVTDGA